MTGFSLHHTYLLYNTHRCGGALPSRWPSSVIYVYPKTAVSVYSHTHTHARTRLCIILLYTRVCTFTSSSSYMSERGGVVVAAAAVGSCDKTA